MCERELMSGRGDERVLCQPVRLSERKKEQKGGFFGILKINCKERSKPANIWAHALLTGQFSNHVAALIHITQVLFQFSLRPTILFLLTYLHLPG
jgi:hypothetical protein